MNNQNSLAECEVYTAKKIIFEMQGCQIRVVYFKHSYFQIFTELRIHSTFTQWHFVIRLIKASILFVNVQTTVFLLYKYFVMKLKIRFLIFSQLMNIVGGSCDTVVLIGGRKLAAQWRKHRLSPKWSIRQPAHQ